jgi:very-short-patch-repair endonuclease
MKLYCENCKKEFEKANREYKRQLKKGREYFFCCLRCSAKHRNRQRGCNEYPQKKICPKCLKEFIVNNKDENRTFCSRSCANSRPCLEETKKKISKTNSIIIKNKWLHDKEYVKKQLNKKNIFTSKGERYIRDYFIENMKIGEWTFGGLATIKKEFISCDLYSRKLKVCFEYDGIWHFEDIKGQLKKKQYKDRLLEEWCLANGWRLIRIKEDIFKQNEEFWLQSIIREVIIGKEQIIKYY